MTTPFTPAGDLPRWEIIYNLFTGLPVGTLITYNHLSEALGGDFLTNRGGLDKATKVLEEKEKRTVTCVRGSGYVVAPATAHEILVKGRKKRAKKQVNRAISLASNVRKDELSPEAAKRLEETEMTLRAHADMLSRMDRRLGRQEATLKEVRRETKTDAAKMDDRMSRLEEMVGRITGAVTGETRT